MHKRKPVVLPLCLLVLVGCAAKPEDAAAIRARLGKSGLITHRTKRLRLVEVDGWKYSFELDQQTNQPKMFVRFSIRHDTKTDGMDYLVIEARYLPLPDYGNTDNAKTEGAPAIHRLYMNGKQDSQFVYHDSAIVDLSEEIHRIAKCVSSQVH